MMEMEEKNGWLLPLTQQSHWFECVMNFVIAESQEIKTSFDGECSLEKKQPLP